jgi:hypothetical protein
MGLIRKTISISTLGIVPFRSKKERLRRAERACSDANRELAAEQAAREAVEGRVSAAEKRAKLAELLALHEAKAANGRRHKRRRARMEKGRTARKEAVRRARHAKQEVQGTVSDLVDAAQPRLDASIDAARRGGRRARRRAKTVAKQAKAKLDA